MRTFNLTDVKVMLSEICPRNTETRNYILGCAQVMCIVKGRDITLDELQIPMRCPKFARLTAENFFEMMGKDKGASENALTINTMKTFLIPQDVSWDLRQDAILELSIIGSTVH